MANARFARFITEVAPPQVVNVVRRRRTSKMLETIKEDEREICSSSSSIDSLCLPTKATYPLSTWSSSAACSSSSPATSSIAKSSSTPTFLKEVHRSLLADLAK